MSKVDFSKYRNIPLDVVMEKLGATLHESDKRKWRTNLGSISVNGYMWFNHNAAVGSGGAIDLALHLLGYDHENYTTDQLKDALEELDSEVSHALTTAEVKKSIKPKATLVVPPPNPDGVRKIRYYLSQVRKLPYSVIDIAMKQGRLYADERKNCVFLFGYDISQKIVGVELRGTIPDKVYHKLVDGSVKSEPFLVVGGSKKTIAVGEAPISVLSYLALNPGITVASTAGAGKELPRDVVRKYLDMGYDVIYISDNDKAGHESYDFVVEEVAISHPDAIIFRDHPDAEGEDWNDVLKAGRKR